MAGEEATVVEPAATPGPRDEQDVVGPPRAPVSSWRMPREGSKIPAYVRRRFHLKTFGLVSVQLVAVLCIMVLVDHSGLQRVLDRQTSRLIFVSLGGATVINMLALQVCRGRYPCNYLLLAVLTLLVGSFWGMGHSVFDERFHIQVAGILTASACTATALMALGAHDGGPGAFIGPLFLGWLVGSGVNGILATCVGVQLRFSLAATGVAFFLLVLLLLGAGKELEACDPDDFMRAIICIDANLMVVVCMPLFCILECMVCSERGVPATPEQAAEQSAEGRAEEGRV